MQAQLSNEQSTKTWMLMLTTENPNMKLREQNVVAHATIWKALHVLFDEVTLLLPQECKPNMPFWNLKPNH
jgi:hypothetical protein